MLKIGGESEMPATEDTVLVISTDEGRQMIAAKKSNAIAMAHITMALMIDRMMSLVFEAMNEDWPGGLAHKLLRRCSRNINCKTQRHVLSSIRDSIKCL